MTQKMDLTHLESSNLEKLLLREENIPILGKIIEHEEEASMRLVRNEDYELKKYTQKELRELLDELKPEVDNFLDSHDVSTPKLYHESLLIPRTPRSIINTLSYSIPMYLAYCGLTQIATEPFMGTIFLAEAAVLFALDGFMFYKKRQSFKNSIATYRPISKKIIVNDKGPKFESNLVETIAHEYTHHVQHQKLKLPKIRLPSKKEKYSIFDEGHAESVSRKVAEAYARKKDPSLVFEIKGNHRHALTTVYFNLLKRFQPQKIDEIISQIPNESRRSVIGAMYEILSKENNQDNYVRGEALFSIYEDQYGPEIYKDVLTGKFKFPIAEEK